MVDPEPMTDGFNREQKDWAGSLGKFALAWGIPIGALVVASVLGPFAKTAAWAAALVWMGVTCLANARGCGRTHCYFTGPFFLIMVVPVVLHGSEIFSLGPEGWRWLGIAIAVGGGALWWIPEMVMGRYLGARASRP